LPKYTQVIGNKGYLCTIDSYACSNSNFISDDLEWWIKTLVEPAMNRSKKLNGTGIMAFELLKIEKKIFCEKGKYITTKHFYTGIDNKQYTFADSVQQKKG
jgi:hypothetical protein